MRGEQLAQLSRVRGAADGSCLHEQRDRRHPQRVAGNDSETVAAIEALADALERRGVTVSRAARPAFDATEAFQLYLQALDSCWSARATEAILRSKREKLAKLDEEIAGISKQAEKDSVEDEKRIKASIAA